MNLHHRNLIINNWLYKNLSLFDGKIIPDRRRYIENSEIEDFMNTLIDKAIAENIYSKKSSRVDIASGILNRIKGLNHKYPARVGIEREYRTGLVPSASFHIHPNFNVEYLSLEEHKAILASFQQAIEIAVDTLKILKVAVNDKVEDKGATNFIACRLVKIEEILNKKGK